MCHRSSSPGLDIVQPCCLRSAPSSGTRCCTLDNLLFQTVPFFLRIRPKYVILAAMTDVSKILPTPLLSVPIHLSSWLSMKPQDHSQTFHLKSRYFLFIWFFQCPALKSVHCYWPHKCLQKSDFFLK